MSTDPKPVWGTVLGWIAIVSAVIAFFWLKVPLSILGALLSIVGLFSEQKTLNGVALAIAAIAFIVEVA